MLKKLGISVKYISRIENGTGGVKVETLVNYMNILGISPNVIFENLIVNDNLKPQMLLSKRQVNYLMTKLILLFQLLIY